MSSGKNKSLVYIILAIVVFVPNMGCLMMALLVLYPAHPILYIVPGIMLVLALFSLLYGLSLRKKEG